MTKAALPSAPKWRQLTRRFALYWQGVDMGVVMMLVTFTGFVALMGWMAYNTFIVPDATPVLRSAYPAAQIIDHQSQTTGFVLDDNGVLRCVGVSRSGEVWVVRSHDTNGLSPDERSRVVWSMTEGCRPGGQFR